MRTVGQAPAMRAATGTRVGAAARAAPQVVVTVVSRLAGDHRSRVQGKVIGRQ
jgi:hypothetical protein